MFDEQNNKRFETKITKKRIFVCGIIRKALIYPRTIAKALPTPIIFKFEVIKFSTGESLFLSVEFALK